MADRHHPPFYKKLCKTLQNADIFENKKRDFVVKHDLENRDLCKGDNMAKANVIRKNSLGIKGVLNVDKDSNSVVVEIEDGEALELASLLDDFNGSEVSISVGESIDIA